MYFHNFLISHSSVYSVTITAAVCLQQPFTFPTGIVKGSIYLTEFIIVISQQQFVGSDSDKMVSHWL